MRPLFQPQAYPYKAAVFFQGKGNDTDSEETNDLGLIFTEGVDPALCFIHVAFGFYPQASIYHFLTI